MAKRNYITSAIIVILIFLVGYLAYTVHSIKPYNTGDMEVIYSDTTRITITDTVKYYKPVPRDSVVVRYITERLPVAGETTIPTSDSVYVAATNDSVNVTIPITQKVYQEEDYCAYVSGYRPQLDSIFVYPKRETITITNEVRKKPKRWGVGVQVGYGLTPHGLEPTISVGVSYNFLQF